MKHKLLIIFFLFFVNLFSAERASLSFDYFYKNALLGQEEVSAVFPNAPDSIRKHGIQAYIAEDFEGTTFAIMAIPIPNAEFDLEASWKSLVNSGQKKQLISADRENDIFSISWVENGKTIRHYMLQSSYFIYYFDVRGKGKDDKKIALDFVHSFQVINGFSFD